MVFQYTFDSTLFFHFSLEVILHHNCHKYRWSFNQMVLHSLCELCRQALHDLSNNHYLQQLSKGSLCLFSSDVSVYHFFSNDSELVPSLHVLQLQISTLDLKLFFKKCSRGRIFIRHYFPIEAKTIGDYVGFYEINSVNYCIRLRKFFVVYTKLFCCEFAYSSILLGIRDWLFDIHFKWWQLNISWFVLDNTVWQTRRCHMALRSHAHVWDSCAV